MPERVTWTAPCDLCGRDAEWSQTASPAPNVVMGEVYDPLDAVLCPRCDKSMRLTDQIERRGRNAA